jgi:hypothetical protein
MRQKAGARSPTSVSGRSPDGKARRSSNCKPFGFSSKLCQTMSVEIPQELVDRMMVKCGRRCCVCRRFRPTRLQVHHIVERNQGGSNEEDNLIVICLTCHTDVHSKVPFARRFTVEELKGHRDALVGMVASGVLPSDDADDTDEAFRFMADTLRSAAPSEVQLIPEAVEMLVVAANSEGNRQGIIVVTRSNRGTSIWAGADQQALREPGDRRSEAKYTHALEQLEDCGLVRERSEAMHEVTYEGYLVADELAARAKSSQQSKNA